MPIRSARDVTVIGALLSVSGKYAKFTKTVEKVIQDENVHFMHMIFKSGEGSTEHFSNSTLYMTVIRGTLSIGLGEQEVNKYEEGTVLKIPVNIKMNVNNSDYNVLELIVVKAPAPQN